MPKAEKGSLKDIGKRIKAKGLQKLKFYCQMCNKQCRDANGFKCHLTSESHIRSMKLFSENATGYMDNYSKQFEKLFLQTLQYKHSTTTINANNVYQEVIRTKDHIHMNSTIWTSLGDFCKYLGKHGKCIVTETERGWYISYIDRDPTKLLQIQQTQQRLYNEKIAEELYEQQLLSQRLVASNELVHKLGTSIHIQPSHILNNTTTTTTNDSNKTIKLQFDTAKMAKKPTKVSMSQNFQSMFGDDDDDDDDDDDEVDDNDDNDDNNNIINGGGATAAAENDDNNDTKIAAAAATTENDDYDNASTNNKKSRALHNDNISDDPIQQQQQLVGEGDHQEVVAESEPWLYKNIMVRIITKQVLVNQTYFKYKGIVTKVSTDDPYVGDVSILVDSKTQKESNIKIRMDQSDLQTIAPKHSGDIVRIVQHPAYKFHKAIVQSINKQQSTTVLQLKKDTTIILQDIHFDYISKII